MRERAELRRGEIPRERNQETEITTWRPPRRKLKSTSSSVARDLLQEPSHLRWDGRPTSDDGSVTWTSPEENRTKLKLKLVSSSGLILVAGD